MNWKKRDIDLTQLQMLFLVLLRVCRPLFLLYRKQNIPLVICLRFRSGGVSGGAVFGSHFPQVWFVRPVLVPIKLIGAAISYHTPLYPTVWNVAWGNQAESTPVPPGQNHYVAWI